MTAPLVLGIDIGGTHMQFGVTDAAGAILGRAAARTEAAAGADRVIAGIAAGARAACAAAGITLDEIAAVGVAAAGAIDAESGIVLAAPNLGWTDVPLRDRLEDALGRRVVVENDVNGAVWGEYHLGAGCGEGDALGVWVGTGVGGGLILGGRLYRGEFSTAGEIGQTVILPFGAPGAEEGARTVEECSSRTGMREIIGRALARRRESVLHQTIGGDVRRLGTAELKEAYERGDGLTVEVVDRAADLLGIAVANWVTVLALRTVFVGGGVTEAFGEPYLDRVRASFERHVFPPRCRACRLLMTKLRSDAGLVGAALLAREKLGGGPRGGRAPGARRSG